jgi:glycosyltransferase involved in cell wall biosynthesis
MATSGGHTDGTTPRVLFAIGSLTAGGSENQLTEFLARAHPDHLHAILVTWRAPEPELANEQRLMRVGVERHYLGFARMPRGLRMAVTWCKSAVLVRRLRPDLVYCWLERSSLFFCPAARAQGIPVVVARRNVSGARMERLAPVSWVIRRVERMATLVTGNSQAVVATAIERGILPGRLRMVPNGHPSMPALAAPESAPVALGCVARFRPEKGHLRLVNVLSRIDPKLSWRIDLAGDGPLLETVRREAQLRGLADRVRFVGAIADVRAFWRDHHIAILMSDAEGSPNALIEAAMAGRPIIGTDVAGIREVVAPAGGVLVPLDDPDASAAAVQRLIETPALRDQLGAGAYAQASERYSMERFVDGHLAVIHEALRVQASE